MLRKVAALILTLILAVTAVPAALASATYSAYTPLSADEDKLANLRLAAQAIDGTTVAAGDSFSFNDTVGPQEKRRGYRVAPNGRDVPVTGGGVAQAATTLYMVLLQMDNVKIDPVKTYGSRFSDDYVQDPNLAIVADYDAGIDLSFTNDTGSDLTIDMWLSENELWCVVTRGSQGGLSNLGGSSDGKLSFLDDDDFFLDDVPAVTQPPISAGTWSAFDAPDKEDDDDSDGRNTLFYTKSDTKPIPGDGHSADIASLGSASINCGGDNDVLHNVKLAAECVNDTMLDAGDVFSFNDVVGPRTNKYGYRRAINGRGAKVTGGGVAQVASVLWLAIENCDDIEVLEKSTYGKHYNQRYVPDAADAILTDYASGRDFRFRYTGRSSLTIYTYVEDGWLYCDIYEG